MFTNKFACLWSDRIWAHVMCYHIISWCDNCWVPWHGHREFPLNKIVKLVMIRVTRRSILGCYTELWNSWELRDLRFDWRSVLERFSAQYKHVLYRHTMPLLSKPKVKCKTNRSPVVQPSFNIRNPSKGSNQKASWTFIIISLSLSIIYDDIYHKSFY